MVHILPQLKQKQKNPSPFTLSGVHFPPFQAWEVNKGINCVTAYLADCETQLSQAPRRGLLYGVPVSLKECFSYKVHFTLMSALPLSLQPVLCPGSFGPLRGNNQVQRP